MRGVHKNMHPWTLTLDHACTCAHMIHHLSILKKDFYSCGDRGTAVMSSATCTCQCEPNLCMYLCQQVAVK